MDEPLGFEAYVGVLRTEVEDALARALPGSDEEPERLHEAMRYAALEGGKRLRAILALASAEACGATRREAMPAAVALELVHAYSLVHDDLPAMDDDDLRRGRPTVHKRYDEATAILAGDALLTHAFGVLVRLRPAERALEAVGELARAAGSHGMVGGQMLDIRAAGGERSAGLLASIHARKTAALIAAAASLGGIAAGAAEPLRKGLALYGERIGLAFQVVDDILDCEGTAATLGKSAGKDQAQGKLTYPAVFGMDASRQRARALADEACAALAPFEGRGERLREIARFAVTRAS